MTAKRTSKPRTIGQLIPDNRNANKHSKKGTEQLQQSLESNGTGRSILISNDNVIIAGNGVASMADKIGMQNIRVIETDGTELIAVKRTDIHSGSKAFYQMALADNIVAKENIVMDAEIVATLCEQFDITDYKDIEPEDPNKGLPPIPGQETIKTLFVTFPKSQYEVIVARLNEVSTDKATAIWELIGKR